MGKNLGDEFASGFPLVPLRVSAARRFWLGMPGKFLFLRLARPDRVHRDRRMLESKGTGQNPAEIIIHRMAAVDIAALRPAAWLGWFYNQHITSFCGWFMYENYRISR